MRYDDEPKFDEYENIVFDWLRGASPDDRVRVQATRRYMFDKHAIEWKDKAALVAAFDLEKRRQQPSAEKAAGKGDPFRVYEIG